MPKDATPEEGFPKRILDLLEAREMSIRELQKALKNAGADNSGYSSVFRYVKGEFPPSVTWVEAAARVLEVPPAHLAFGGESTAQGSVRRHMEDRGFFGDPESERPVRHALGMVTASTVGAYGVGEDVMMAIVAGLVRAQPKGSPEPTVEELSNLAVRLGFAVMGLLGAVRREGPGHLMAGGHLGVLSALLAHLPAPTQGRSLDDVLRTVPTPPKAREATR